MIELTIRSGKYSKKTLDKALSSFFDTQRDIDLFLEALVETGQVAKERQNYVFPEAEKHIYKKPRYVDFPTYSYAKNRVGIRAGKEWVERYGYPIDMYLSKVFVDGKWVNIKEKPKLSLVKGRYPETIEAWRAEIPAPIRRKYNITPNTPIHTRVESISYKYFATLKLWGYRYRVMLDYGETKNGINPRDLELDGRNFTNQVKKDISNSIEKDKENIRNLILNLLEKADPEYYGLYRESENADNVGENIEAIPLRDDTKLAPVVELRDLENKRRIIEWNTEEKKHIPKPSDFKTTFYLDMGLAQKRGQTKLTIKWRNRGGFK